MIRSEQVRVKHAQKLLAALLWPAALLVFLSSSEVLLTVKDADLFSAWVESGGTTFDQYLLLNLFTYLFEILYPVAFSLYTIWALPRFGITRYYRIVWILLGVLSLFYKVVSFRWQSVYYYLNILLYFVLLFKLAVFKLKMIEEKNRNER